MKAEPQRICPNCGNEFSGAVEFCPVCMLRQALAGESSASEEAVKPTTPEQATQRFEHYELVNGQDGKPVELGRGAMGVTYKAVHVELHCPVTLKVISERYLGDESARLRFLREARAAASVRHSNVASVFHLGKTGQNYYYAMEFVEGETLENLIKRSGRLEVKLALEIATQVAAGLAAVHKQKLVHRDIKPSNIMVNVEEGNAITAKIIDLGLAKPSPDAPAEAAISTPGAFAGTPGFASPEQFAGVGVDIRSDLYSLGATFWKMVTGHTVFRGSPAEVMYQHQHTSLPFEELEHVPQPLVVLIEVLLEKDPGRRFQSPAELLKAIPTITGAIDARRRITRQSLQKTPSIASRVGTRKPPARLPPKKISVARLPVTGSDVFGREEDLAFLDGAWANKDINVVTIVAWAVSGNPAWLTIGSDEWPLNIIVLRNSFLAGPSIDRAPAGKLRPQMNFLTRPSHGLRIPIHGLERLGKGREIGETHRTSSNIIDSGRPGAAPKSAWPPRRTVTGAFPSGATARACCLQSRALRDYHAAAGH